MQRLSRKLILIVSFALVFALIWQKVHIWISVRLSVWQALFFFGVLVLVAFLTIDHFINGGRG